MKTILSLVLAASASLHASTILIDLGSGDVTTPTPITYRTAGNWNNITNSTSGSVTNLIDSEGNATTFEGVPA